MYRFLLLAGVGLTAIGLWGLTLQAQQARDVKRKLDLEDLEVALNRLLAGTGTLPPEEETTWCGRLGDPANVLVRDRIEESLRQTKKYAKPEKPFPRDPRWGNTDRDYLYWKTSPVSFELLAHLEADENDSRPLDLTRCSLTENAREPNQRSSPERVIHYDYAIISTQRPPP